MSSFVGGIRKSTIIFFLVANRYLGISGEGYMLGISGEGDIGYGDGFDCSFFWHYLCRVCWGKLGAGLNRILFIVVEICFILVLAVVFVGLILLVVG